MNEELGRKIEEWDRLARSTGENGVPVHSRGSQLSAPTTANRIIELTQLVNRLSMALQESCFELRRYADKT